MPLTADEHELRAWIRLGLERELDAARIRELLAVFGMPQDIYAASTGSLARHLDADPEDVLRGANRKFERRFAFIERALAQRGLSPQQSSLAEMDDLWNAAKAAEATASG